MPNYPTALYDFTALDVVDNVDDVQAVDINDLHQVVDGLQDKVGIDSSGVDTSLDYKVNNFFVEATRILYFYEDTPPTGWSTSGLPTDRVLAIKGGIEAYNIAGGAQGGTWTQPSHQLIVAEMPAHTHGCPEGNFLNTTDEDIGAGGNDYGANPDTSSTGGDGSHSHGGITYRPYAAVGILATYVGS